MKHIHYSELLECTTRVLSSKGCTPFVANSVARGLCETSLRGVDSHGIRLLPHYLNAVHHGRINPKPNFKSTKNYSSFLALDADNSFGHAAGFYAIEKLIQIASTTGVAIASVFNSSHPGAMASFAYRATEAGYCCFAFTHADSLIQSHLGRSNFFGTNPICFAAPRASEDHPFCVDMAPSYIPWNQILNFKERSQSIPGDYAVDKDGNITYDPNQASGLLPIAGHKGFALAAMVEVLCSCISGMRSGPDIPPMYSSPIDIPRRLGQFYIVFKPDGVISQSLFERSLSDLSESVRSSSPGNTVLMPNDPQIECAQARLITGIPVSSEVLKVLGL